MKQMPPSRHGGAGACIVWTGLFAFGVGVLESPAFSHRRHSGEGVACIAASAEESGCQVIEIGGIEDHVHLLVRITLTISIADLAHDVKGASSHLITHRLAPELGFKWQGSYGAFSVSPYHVRKVANYIRNQAAHHAENTTIPQFERSSTDPNAMGG